MIMGDKSLKFGIALYSFADSFSAYRLDMEGMLKTVHELGGTGISIVAAQHVPEYPYISDEWLYNFRLQLRKYDLEPVCWEGYIDMRMRSDRDLNREEILEFVKNDIVYARKAGFHMVKTQHSISPEIFKSLLPFCRKMDVKLAIELHQPHHLQVPVWQEYLKIFAESGGYLGCVPDLSIWQHFPHQLHINQALDAGCRKEKIDEILVMMKNGKSLEEVLALDLTATEKQYAGEFYHKFGHPSDLADLRVILQYTTMIHGKFHYLTDATYDPCVPFDKIMPIIRESGFDGYILAEYEGHHYSIREDDVEQCRLALQLMKNLYSA
jgi:sugar phosphate isomerase/epimerase